MISVQLAVGADDHSSRYQVNEGLSTDKLVRRSLDRRGCSDDRKLVRRLKHKHETVLRELLSSKADRARTNRE